MNTVKVKRFQSEAMAGELSNTIMSVNAGILLSSSNDELNIHGLHLKPDHAYLVEVKAEKANAINEGVIIKRFKGGYGLSFTAEAKATSEDIESDVVSVWTDGFSVGSFAANDEDGGIHFNPGDCYTVTLRVNQIEH